MTAIIPFPFKGYSPTPFAIEPYFFCCNYSGFPPLFYCYNPIWGIVVELLPST
nr:MAG TPA: hypothetical protein [Caudoviricetes sp.]